MRKESGNSSSFRESSYRVTVLVVVISCHLGLLMLLLRPVVSYRGTAPVVRNNPTVLRLRFFRPQLLSPSYPALPAYHLAAPVMQRLAALSARSSKPLAVRKTAPVDGQPDEARLTSARNPNTGEGDSANDGGFRQRLHEAQHAHSVHGVPGSDTPYAPGIHSVDSMNQGIGAVMRTAQRAFGIKSRRCIDVDAWRHLTPQELSARHISPGDVDEVDEKYGCNKPPGLRF